MDTIRASWIHAWMHYNLNVPLYEQSMFHLHPHTVDKPVSKFLVTQCLAVAIQPCME